MVKARVVVYGLSTEGYEVATQMAIKGADVHIIDESTSSAILLNSEIAKTYPNVSSLRDDEPLLVVEPIATAISNAEYLFFTPRIRTTDEDTRSEASSKFKDAVAPLKKDSTVVYALPTGFGENQENLTLLEHVTGLEVEQNISYFYYPLSSSKESKFIGTFNEKEDSTLTELLTKQEEKKFISTPALENLYAIDILSKFITTCSTLEVCKLDNSDKNDMYFGNLEDLYLDDMVTGMFDLKSIHKSFEGSNPMTYIINGGLKGLDNYIKRLIDEIRSTLKRYQLKASRTKVAISWTFDMYEMRNDRVEMEQNLVSKLRDYMGSVEAFDPSKADLFHGDRKTVIIACSKLDYEKVVKYNQDLDFMIVKANSLCEVMF